MPTPPHRVVRAADHRLVPWKNGRGVTTEIAIAPAGATLQSGFDWRISAAAVDEDGPFSSFPGIDRTLVLLEGEGMELRSPDGVLAVERRFDLVSFPGEATIEGRLRAGPVRDLNVMTRRATCGHEAAVRRGPATLGAGGLLVVVALEGAVRVDGVALGPLEAVIGLGPRTVEGEGTVLVVRLAAPGPASHCA